MTVKLLSLCNIIILSCKYGINELSHVKNNVFSRNIYNKFRNIS